MRDNAYSRCNGRDGFLILSTEDMMKTTLKGTLPNANKSV
jgi:hypothetical protein